MKTKLIILICTLTSLRLKIPEPHAKCKGRLYDVYEIQSGWYDATTELEFTFHDNGMFSLNFERGRLSLNLGKMDTNFLVKEEYRLILFENIVHEISVSVKEGTWVPKGDILKLEANVGNVTVLRRA